MSSARASGRRSRLLRDPVLAPPLVVAIILIVYGRVNRRGRWGNLIAVAGYALLAITIVIALVIRD